MISRILLAVDDSAAALAAARFAVDLAAACGAALNAVHVLADGELTATLAAVSGEARAGGVEALAWRRRAGGEALLHHVADLGARAGIHVELNQLWGEPASRILEQAGACNPELIVVGRSDRPDPRQPYVGSQTRQVLEFAEQPVVVVPPSRKGTG